MYIEFSYDVKEAFGKGCIKVHAMFDDVMYDACLVRMKTLGHSIGRYKHIRSKIHK